MLIGGLWHGAAWTFVAWGALHGVALCVHKLWMKLVGHDKYYKGTTIGNIVSGVVTYLFVAFCWIFFRANTFENAWQIIKAIFTWQDGVCFVSSWTILGILLTAVCTSIACIRSKKQKTTPDGFYLELDLNTIIGMTIFLVVLGMTLGLAYTGSNPFIYFQF